MWNFLKTSNPKTSNSGFRRLISLAVAAGVLNLSAMGVFASPRGSAESLGMLRVSGGVTVNDVPALSGLTILSGSRIVTSTGSSSVLELGKQTRLMLSEQTELALEFCEDNLSGSLQKGAIHVFIPANRELTLATPAGVLATDSSQLAAVRIEVGDGGTRISVEQGRVELRAGKNMRPVVAGETFSTVGDRSLRPLQQNLSGTGRIGLVAGIGAGLAILLLALSGDAEPDFGGCVITLSPIDGGPPPCS
jgi:ferric-dicitrate binding protein FerR (iron transport regulator)